MLKLKEGITLCSFLLLLLLCGRSFAQSRSVHISIAADWVSNPLAEMAEYIADQSNDLFFSFLTSICKPQPPIQRNYSSAFSLASSLLPESEIPFLQTALHLGFYKPKIEFDIAANPYAKRNPCQENAYFVALPHKTIFCSFSSLKSFLESNSSRDVKEEKEEGEDFIEHSLSRTDHIFNQSLALNSPKVVLYGSYDSSDFCGLYNEAVESLQGAFTTPFHLAIRFASTHKKDSNLSSEERTYLNGYGVFLDIKNMEYKALDDRVDLPSEEEEVGQKEEDIMEEGQEGKPEGEAALKPIEDSSEVEGSEEKVEIKQLRDLGLQVVSAVIKEADVLTALEDVLYNFPSKAPQLSKRRITRSLRNAVGMWYERAMYNSLAHNSLYINGLRIDLGGATFNIFDIFAKVKAEVHSLQALSLLPISDSIRTKVLSLAMSMGSSASSGINGIPEIRRIDVSVGSKRVFTFLNNLEKDSMYHRFSPSLRQLLMPAWSLHTIAKNMYTLICVIDPLTLAGAELMLSMKEMWKQTFPIRFGFVLFGGKNVNSSVDKTTSLDSSSKKSLATRQHVSDLFFFAKEYFTSSAAISFLVNLFEKSSLSTDETETLIFTWAQLQDAFAKAIKKKDNKKTLVELRSLAGSILTHNLAEVEEILDRNVTFDYRSMSLLSERYISARNLPLNSFSLNGMVVASSSDLYTDVMQLMSREQYILGMYVRAGLVTDDDESIFASILAASGTSFSRYHPQILNGPLEYLDIGREATRAALSGLRYLESSQSSESEMSSTFVSSVEVGISCDSIGFETLAGALLWFKSADRVRLAIAITEDHSTLLEPLALLIERVMDTLMSNMELISVYAELIQRLASSSWTGLLGQEDFKLVDLFIASENGYEEVLALSAWWDEGRRICAATESKDRQFKLLDAGLNLQLVTGSTNFVMLNGRLLRIINPMQADDFRLLEDVEESRVTSRLRSIFSEEPNASCSPDLVTRLVSFCGRYNSGTSPRTDVASFLAENDFAVDKTEFIVGVEPEVHLESDVAVFVVIDPLTTAAQKSIAVMRLLQENLHIPFTLVMVPLSRYESFPLQNFYRFVRGNALGDNDSSNAGAVFNNLPRLHVLTVRPDVPESWNVQAIRANQDIDNLKCDSSSCGDGSTSNTKVLYRLKNLLVAGQCYESIGDGRPIPPKGLQLLLTNNASSFQQTDSLVMQNFGYFQFQANPGVWYLNLAAGRPRKLFHIESASSFGKTVLVNSFVNSVERVNVAKKPGFERYSLQTIIDEADEEGAKGEGGSSMWSTLSSMWSSPPAISSNDTSADPEEFIHVFSLATGHMYERLLRIMMLSVIKRTSVPVKFWLFENYLSPKFKALASTMAQEYGFQVNYVTYKWPEWLTQQTEKQRIIWGYKILFLDVLFPLEVKKIIYIDADQILRADLKELWDIDLQGKPYGYTPFCSSREDTLGFQFWRSGFWAQHLRGLPYHISALYVVDLEVFRRNSVGDTLRATYDALARDPNSLANLDQDLPNYAQHEVPIHSLPQEWLWCESWCSEETKSTAKTIDLCNNPLYKEPKLDMARRIVSGSLFNESWVELDEEIRRLEESKK